MPTIQQLVRKGRTVLVEKSKSRALDACPQRRGGRTIRPRRDVTLSRFRSSRNRLFPHRRSGNTNRRVRLPSACRGQCRRRASPGLRRRSAHRSRRSRSSCRHLACAQRVQVAVEVGQRRCGQGLRVPRRATRVGHSQASACSALRALHRYAMGSIAGLRGPARGRARGA